MEMLATPWEAKNPATPFGRFGMSGAPTVVTAPVAATQDARSLY
jgi:hypothetical protein